MGHRVLAGSNTSRLAIVSLIAFACAGWTDRPVTARPSSDADTFRLLTIGGSAIRWRRQAGEPLTLRISIASSRLDQPHSMNCQGINPPRTVEAAARIAPERFKAAVRTASDRWQQVTAVRFVEVENQSEADIVIGEQTTPSGYAWTSIDLAGNPGDRVRFIDKASICLNPAKPWKLGFDGNLGAYDLVHTITHELGHAIGLDHPGARGHLMSFRYDETRIGLTAGDITGARALYGEPQAPASRPARQAETSFPSETIETARDLPADSSAARSTIGRGMVDSTLR